MRHSLYKWFTSDELGGGRGGGAEIEFNFPQGDMSPGSGMKGCQDIA